MPIKKVEYSLAVRLAKELEAVIREETNVKDLAWKKSKGIEIEVLDLGDTDPKNLAEGYARDMIRDIQNFRKEKGCEFNALISISYPSSDNAKLALKYFKDYVLKSALVKKLSEGDKYDLF